MAAPDSHTIELLSGSTNGRGIKIVATATAGTTVHQAINDVSDIDLITLYAFNSDTVDRLLTLEWGGVTDPDDLIEITVPAGEVILLCEDRPLNNNLTVAAFAAATNVVMIYGSVLRADKA